MSFAALIRQLADAGTPVEGIILALEAVEARENADNDRKARDAEKSAQYRARLGLSFAEWERRRRWVIERDKCCTYCGARHHLTCDHIIPLVRGGTSELENLTTACVSCNSSKGDRLLSEWRL